MHETSRSPIATALIVIVVIIVGVLVWKYLPSKSGTTIPTDMSTISTTSPISTAPAPSTSAHSSGITVGAGDMNIEQSIAKTDLPRPDFTSPIPCTLAVEVCTQVKSQQSTIISTLTKKPTDFWAWIDLGTLYKMTGDYRRAANIWEYVSAMYPKNITSFANLGDVYQNYLKEYARAESNYRTEIINSPAYVDSYRNLFTLYTTSTYHPSVTAAEDILKKGITANPKAVDLQVILARYYKSQGRTADAKTEYKAAIANAKSQGQASLATQIQQELDSM